MNNIEKPLSVYKAVRYTIPLVIKSVPLASLLSVLLAALNGASWGLVAPINRHLYDALIDLAAGQGLLRFVYTSIAMVIALMLMQQLISAVHSFISYYALKEKASGCLAKIIFDKVSLLPAQFFEDKDRLDDIEKAGSGKDGAINMYISISDGLFFYSAYYGIMGTFLWQMEPVLLLAVVFIFTPVLLTQIVEAKIYSKLEDVSAPIRRQYFHYEYCLTGSKTMKETRIFGAYFFFMQLFRNSLELLMQNDWDAHKKITAIHLCLNIIKGAGWVGVIILLFRSLMEGSITVGAFAAVFTSVGMMFNSIEGLLIQIKSNITQNLGRIHNFIRLLDVPILETNNNTPDFTKGVIAESITFAYPKSEKNAVDSVSIVLKPGETLALVGENGSGKTTLVKLLCGLYKPDKGHILIGGCNTTNTASSALFSKTSGVFQNYCCYVFELEENVRISSAMSTNDPIPALIDADVDYKDEQTFPNGLKTILDREYGGVDLSGGQWQRVATARGLYRQHDFIVLDEPTSAIDPIEETRIYKRFAELTRDKMAIIVTHRLGSVRIADRIVVMDSGKIIESGTHEELLVCNGKYTEMWMTQAENYK